MESFSNTITCMSMCMYGKLWHVGVWPLEKQIHKMCSREGSEKWEEKEEGPGLESSPHWSKTTTAQRKIETERERKRERERERRVTTSSLFNCVWLRMLPSVLPYTQVIYNNQQLCLILSFGSLTIVLILCWAAVVWWMSLEHASHSGAEPPTPNTATHTHTWGRQDRENVK